jgi:hypothetical protein
MNHSFIVCGDRAIYLIYEPRFLEVSCRQQAILSVELDDTGMQHYKDLKEKCPGSIIRLITNHKVYFSDILEQKCIEWNMAVADEKYFPPHKTP